jgi:3-oxoacyl-[acyl-carrier protein] reductase
MKEQVSTSTQDDATVAVVTGAAGGIGRVLAQALLEAGCDVVATSLGRDVATLDPLVRFAAPGRRLVCVGADLATGEGRAAVVDAVRRQFGGLTCLINNAGVGMSSIRADYHDRPVGCREVSAETLRRFLDINAHAPMALTLALLPFFTKCWGRIVAIGTSLNAMLRAGFLPYGMSKAALESGCAILARELDGSGITVNVINPGGPVDTPMAVRGTPQDRHALIPPRMLVPPVLWLASRAADGVSGKRITATRWNPASIGEALTPIGWPQLAGDSLWRPSD